MTSRSHRSSRPIPTPSGGAVAGVAAGGMVGVAGAGGSGAGMDGMGPLAGMGSSQGWSSSGGSVVGGGQYSFTYILTCKGGTTLQSMMNAKLRMQGF